jgi:lipopolysaccharide/colanic/teichoic acid biosynthesis glycosyltransferase
LLKNLHPSALFRYRIIKRTLDIAAVALALPILAPLFLALTGAALITAPGPVFYSHRRIRQHGAFFPMWKFRTMCLNSAEVLEAHLTRHPEARAEWNTTHKLPQIWNVLTGHMSLVGPRPIVAAEVEKYKDSFTSYCRVKPGLTGLWQVSGRCTLTYDQRVALDRDYVEHWSLLRDLKILLKTIPSVLNRAGAF